MLEGARNRLTGLVAYRGPRLISLDPGTPLVGVPRSWYSDLGESGMGHREGAQMGLVPKPLPYMS